ncbi:MAG: PulJ/GspJ family protein [Luteimonas sp.]
MSLRGHPRQTGFTLLEAIIALVIFAMGALALYAWLGVNVRTLLRVQEHRESAALMGSALDSMRRINPMETPRGRREVGDVVLEWDAKPVEPARNALSPVGLPTIFQVGLFTTEVRLLRGGAEVGRFEVRQLGHQQTASLEEE